MAVTRRRSSRSPSPVKAAAVEPPMSPNGTRVITKWSESAGTGDRDKAMGLPGFIGRVVHQMGTLLLLVICPLIAVYLWYIDEHCDGSVAVFVRRAAAGGLPFLNAAYVRPSARGFAHVAVFGAVQAALQLLVPGRRFLGPPTPRGNVPVYKANGVQCYFATLALFFAGARAGLFDPAAVYEEMGEILSALNAFSLVFCAALVVKGRLAPSSSDHGSAGSLLFDFYWGRELFPRLGPLDLKTWTNCRMGMMSWAVLPLCYAAAQARALGSPLPSASMAACVALMQAYVLKFFAWETGYWASMDIAHDRAGFYLCWGCLVWVPAVYTQPAMWLVRRPAALHPAATAAIVAFGLAMIAVNYDSDRQRQAFRASGGKQKVWGRPPATIVARYVTGDGHMKTSLLLASGWWGVARHFHYLPEVLAAAAWSATSGRLAVLPLFYPAFLAVLLADRAHRDDERCAAKYGKYWEQYTKAVPYRVVPGIF